MGERAGSAAAGRVPGALALPSMGVSCKRVGCRVPASTTLVIDAASAAVTLVDVETAPVGVTLCSVHVASVTPPVGWDLVDARDPNLRLLAVEARPGEPAPRAPRRATAAAAPALADEPFPWVHRFEGDDEPATLNASSPLLSRAFRSAV